ncbi:unnamed protein product [Mytilus coruscus]|uniref:WSC domain-containing protein n=1 Tax=Mytilus coruscus TaxID=42192 RepID=A0A6J8BXD0_MYTCO|nr:unnamed protein product [Mytilus coruscus]
MNTAKETIPCNMYNPHTKPYWNEDVKNAHTKECKMSRVWIQDGRPRESICDAFANYFEDLYTSKDTSAFDDLTLNEMYKPYSEIERVCKADEDLYLPGGPISCDDVSSVIKQLKRRKACDIQYLGCYNDNIFRMLDDSHRDDKMTIEMCKQLCNKHRYMGLQASDECYSGDSLGNLSFYQKKSDDQCNQRCNGNSSQICGGS